MVDIVVWAVAAALCYMSCLWAVGQLLHRNDVADVAWGPGFLVVALVAVWQAGTTGTKVTVMLAMLAVWAVRLALHIGLRHRNKPEDGRYQDLRKTWKRPALDSYVRIFVVQAVLIVLGAIPLVLAAQSNSVTFTWYNYVGFAIWAYGLFFEVVGDWQLKEFIKQRAAGATSHVMQTGLWRYTRHPNYFGEVSLWWGMYLFLLPFDYWAVGVIGPLTVTYLILGLSGVPLLEKRYANDEEYQRYAARTSSFFPLPPKQVKR